MTDQRLIDANLLIQRLAGRAEKAEDLCAVLQDVIVRCYRAADDEDVEDSRKCGDVKRIIYDTIGKDRLRALGVAVTG